MAISLRKSKRTAIELPFRELSRLDDLRLDLSRRVEEGPTDAVFRTMAHPYARGLLASTIHGAMRGQRLQTIPGTPPSLDKPPRDCSFAPRCGLAQPRCSEAPPPNVAIGPGRLARCVLAEPAGSVAAT